MRKFLKTNWLYLAGGVLVLILYFLRLYHLTILPVFADEAIYIRWAQIMKAEETLRFLPLSDGKQPLFMWVTIPVMKMFSDPLYAGRFVSVMSGFGTLVGVTFLSWLLFKSKKVALAAAFIYAVSPFTFFFDRLALVDSMLSMFGVWTFIFAYLAITRERWDFAMLAGFALGGAWLTKSSALFFALMIPVLWIFSSWKKGTKNIFSRTIKLIGLTLPIIIIGYGMYNILRLGPNFSQIAKRNLDYVWPLSRLLTSPLDPLKPFLDRSREWLWMMGPFGLFVTWVLGYFLNYKKYWKELAALSVWFLAPIIIQSEFAKVLTARYILFSIPYMIIIAASVFIKENKTWTKILAVVIAFLIAQSLIFNQSLLNDPQKANLPRSERSGYLEEWTAGYGIREIAESFKSDGKGGYPIANVKAGEKIVIGTEGFFGTLPDGLQMYLNNQPQVLVIGVGLDFDKLPQPLVDSKESGNKTYLVVNRSRFHKAPEDLGLTIISEYPKAVTPDGSRDALLLMEVTNDKETSK
ncbi:MAG TPA: glycosyltransferase family 39 protein [Patescibacteria group bacterium]|nr:glycosyltransferase family 39 protein [Patescibacteria group bacterium]